MWSGSTNETWEIGKLLDILSSARQLLKINVFQCIDRDNRWWAVGVVHQAENSWIFKNSIDSSWPTRISGGGLLQVRGLNILRYQVLVEVIEFEFKTSSQECWISDNDGLQHFTDYNIFESVGTFFPMLGKNVENTKNKVSSVQPLRNFGELGRTSSRHHLTLSNDLNDRILLLMFCW